MKIKGFILLAFVPFVFACASKEPSVSQVYAEYREFNIFNLDFDMLSAHYDCSQDAFVMDVRMQEVFCEFHVPLTMTPRVQYYLDFFTKGNGRASMQRWIDRSSKYTHITRETFIREGVPLDLVALAYTESGFNPTAVSRAGATGMWQFMRGTGQRYGLQVTDWTDERRDFEKATTAAARHLRDLHEHFDDWYLALAAYNAGAGRITRAKSKHNTDCFFTIAADRRTLMLETRDYVPKYLAQLMIHKNMSYYGFNPPSAPPLLFDKIEVNQQTNLYVLADVLDISLAVIRELNPELRTPMTPPVPAYTIRVPQGRGADALAFVNDPNTDPARYRVYRARAGEKVNNVARSHKVDLNYLKRLNNLKLDTVYMDKILFIPNGEFGFIDEAFAQEIASLAPTYYTVRRGDTLTGISHKHNMPLQHLLRLNPKLNTRRNIYPGQVIVVSQGGAGARL